MDNLTKIVVIIISLFHVYCDQPATVAVMPSIRDVSYVNENEGRILTQEGKVFRFFNDSLTEEKIKNEATVRHIYFLNTNEGWILDSEGQIWATSNSGKDWGKKGKIATVSPTDLSSKLLFVDNQIGWAINSSSILLTEDGGNSWNQVYPNSTFSYMTLESDPISFFSVNKDTYWLAMTNSKILRTTDRGKSWESMTIPAKSDIHSLYAFNDKQCFVAAWNAGGLYYTDDGGKNWQQRLTAEISKNLGITSISFSTPEIGWIVGREFVKDIWSPNKLNGVVLKTTNGGKTWIKAENEFYKNPFHEIKFISPQDGWIIGEKAVYKTSDGGNNWQKIFQID